MAFCIKWQFFVSMLFFANSFFLFFGGGYYYKSANFNISFMLIAIGCVFFACGLAICLNSILTYEEPETNGNQTEVKRVHFSSLLRVYGNSSSSIDDDSNRSIDDDSNRSIDDDSNRSIDDDSNRSIDDYANESSHAGGISLDGDENLTVQEDCSRGSDEDIHESLLGEDLKTNNDSSDVAFKTKSETGNKDSPTESIKEDIKLDKLSLSKYDLYLEDQFLLPGKSSESQKKKTSNESGEITGDNPEIKSLQQGQRKIILSSYTSGENDKYMDSSDEEVQETVF